MRKVSIVYCYCLKSILVLGPFAFMSSAKVLVDCLFKEGLIIWNNKDIFNFALQFGISTVKSLLNLLLIGLRSLNNMTLKPSGYSPKAFIDIFMCVSSWKSAVQNSFAAMFGNDTLQHTKNLGVRIL